MTAPRFSRAWLIVPMLVLTALACNAADVTALVVSPTPQPRPATATPLPPPPTPTPANTPTPMPGQSSVPADEMAAALRDAALPVYDPFLWLAGLGALEGDPGRTLDESPGWEAGDTETFTFGTGGVPPFGVDPLTGEEATLDTREVRAELRLVTDQFYVWADTTAGDEAADFRLRAAVDEFSRGGQQVVQEAGGSEWTPGMDADERLHVVYVVDLGVDSLFRRFDEFPRALYTPSAEREVVFVDLALGQPNTDASLGALTQAYWELVQYNLDANEPDWAAEGLARLVASQAGGASTEGVSAFVNAADTRLNASPGPDAVLSDVDASAGASYLYHLYLGEQSAGQPSAGGQIGLEALAGATGSPLNGLDAVDAALGDLGLEVASADNLFFDWTVANLIDNPNVADGQYGYSTLDISNPCPVVPLDSIPKTETYTIAPYSAHYHEMLRGTTLNLAFEAPTTARLLPADPFEGGVAWWSGRGEWVQSTLTREVDLTDAPDAALDFSAWYDIPPGQGALYVLVSTDDGETWTAMEGGRSAMVGEQPAYTGVSGGGEEPIWVLERVDLTSMLGQEFLLRIAYVTEGGDSGPGVMLDNITIVRAGLFDGAEALDSAWDVEGWLRTSGVVPDDWALYVVSESPGGLEGVTHTVTPIEVSADGTANVTRSLPNAVTRSWVVVARAGRGVETPADYTLTIDGDFPLAAVAELPANGLAAENFELSCGLFRRTSGETFSQNITGGALQIQVTEPDTTRLTLLEDEFEDTVLSVDTALPVPSIQGTLWGAACRVQDADNYYGFQLRGDGAQRIIAVVDGELTELSPFEVAEEAETGAGAANNVVAACVGDILSLTVNGTVVADAEDSTFGSGQAGLLVASGANAPVSASFDNFVLTEAAEEGTAAPAATPEPEEEVCDCSGNIYDCRDFASFEQAQACFDFCGGRANDVHLLDADLNGIACETVFQ